ncbi:MAG TPA: hypothetical protein VIC85_13030 [Ktedonobacterales bacterium]|jgi:hypothetical protein
MRRIKYALTFVLAALALTVMAASPTASANTDHREGRGDGGLAAVRAATARYHRLDVATANGYGLLKDAAGIACIDNQPVGAMGVHFVNGELVGSGKIDALKPQALVYEPGENGQMRLVAVEYIAFQGPWDATHDMAPMLFGQMFMLTTAPNRFGLPPFYSLHAWVWKNNPSGTFSMWNPTVHCPAAATTPRA